MPGDHHPEPLETAGFDVLDAVALIQDHVVVLEPEMSVIESKAHARMRKASCGNDTI